MNVKNEEIDKVEATIKRKDYEIKEQNNIIQLKSAESVKLRLDLDCDKFEFKAKNLSSLVKHHTIQQLKGESPFPAKIVVATQKRNLI